MRHGCRLPLSGFLSGALSLWTLILLLLVGVALFEASVGLLRQEAVAEATGGAPARLSTGEFVRASLERSARNGLSVLWQARWGYAVAGVLGIAGALGYRVGRGLAPRRAAWVSFGFLAAAVVIPTMVWAFAQREAVALWVLETPELYSWKDLLLASYATEAAVTIVFALTAAYPFWAAWRWWYARLHPAALTAPVPHPIGAGMVTRRWLVGLGIAFLVCLGLFFWVRGVHERAKLHLQHDVAWVDERDQRQQAFQVEVPADAQRVRIVNINGLGSVSIYLSPTADPADAVSRVEDWAFEWRLDEYIYTDLPIAGVAPGAYYLIFVQRSGWGYFEFTLGSGGGWASHAAALALGFLLSGVIVLGAALVALVLIRMDVIRVEPV